MENGHFGAKRCSKNPPYRWGGTEFIPLLAGLSLRNTSFVKGDERRI